MLLSLKGQRFSIFLSKLVVILLSVFCFYGVILINLGIGALLMNALLLDGTVANQLMTTIVTKILFLLGLILPLLYQ